MDNYIDGKLLALEKVLCSESEGPIAIPFSVLECITNNFSENQNIGIGGFGKVYKGELRNGRIAVKKLNENIKVLEKNFDNEVSCLTDIKHKNTVRFLGYCSETQNVRLPYQGNNVWAEVRQRLLCFQYLSGGSLDEHVKDPSSGLPWIVRYQIVRGICEGVHYLHQQHMVHMDLKPQNVLLDHNKVPKVADFGLSRRLSESKSREIATTIVGSRGYMAPEFLTDGNITFKADVYSLGVIIIEMLTGCKESPKVDEILQSWTNQLGTSESQIQLEQVKVCAEMAIQCMDTNPQNRPTMTDIICRLFGEEDISNWSVRGAVGTSSISQRCSFMDKVVDELKSMNLLGRSFQPKRVTALRGARETRTETIRPGLTDSNLLDVHPIELRFSMEAKKRMSCPLNLTNKANRYVAFRILPQFPDRYFCEENLSGVLMPMSTCGISVTMVEPQQRPLISGYLNILMVTTESKSTLSDLRKTIGGNLNKDDDDDLMNRVKKIGGEIHLAMVTTVVCPPSEAMTPKILFAKEIQSVDTMDVHPTEPWILITQNRERVTIWNYVTQKVVASFDADEKAGPLWNAFKEMASGLIDEDILVLSAKFIPRMKWIVTGDQLGYIRVYNYVTMKEIKKFKSSVLSCVHSFAVHPTYPLLLSVTESFDGDDNMIKLWNWESNWRCSLRIRGGMSCGANTRLKFNPNDNTTFSGGRVTCTIWSIHSSDPVKTITEGNISVCDYVFTESAKQYLLTDSTAHNGVTQQIWDVNTERRVHTLVWNGESTASFACHPTLSIIVTGSPDGKDPAVVCFWNSRNYRLQKTIRSTLGSSIRDFEFIGSKRLVIRCNRGIEVVEIDLEALACQQ